jgi:Protein of unknown function (DUF3800)
VSTPAPIHEKDFVPHLFCYCDESGKHNEHPIVVFNALVDGFKSWEDFSVRWAQLLNRYRLTEFHAKEALRHSQPYGTMNPGTAEKRAEDVLPFVREIVEGIAFGVIAAVDVRAYKLPTLHKLRLNISDDPHFFALYLTVSAILRRFTEPSERTVGLILDDDEEKAIRCYKFLGRMKRANPEVRQRIPSICFMDDSPSPQVQATDLFAYLCRVDAELRFLGKEHPYRALCEEFNVPRTGKERIEIAGGFYGELHLRDYMESREEKQGK